MRSLLNRKAQFFVLTVFAIISSFYLLSKWIEPGTVIDTSSIVLAEEPFVFANIVEMARKTVVISESCEGLVNNIEEFVYFAKKFTVEKGQLLISYELESPCRLPNGQQVPTVVDFNITLTSPRMTINSNFYETWNPP